MLKVKNLEFSYPKNPIFSDLNLELGAGIHIIRAGNGRGKSTFFNILLGNLKYKGVITLDNELLKRDDIYVLPQKNSLLNYSVVDLITLVNKEQKELIISYCELFNVPLTHVKKLSGGQRQKLCIIFLLVSDAKVLLIDEPFNNIDRESKVKIIEMLSLKKEQIILIASHPKDEIDNEFLNNSKVIELSSNLNYTDTKNVASGSKRNAIKRNYLIPKVLILLVLILVNFVASIILYNQLYFENSLKYFDEDNVYYYDTVIEDADYVVAPVDSVKHIANPDYEIIQIPYSEEVRMLINEKNMQSSIEGSIPEDNTNQILVPDYMYDIEIAGYEIVGTYETMYPGMDIIYYSYQDNTMDETASICVGECPSNYVLTNEDTLNSFVAENKKVILLLVIIIILNVAVFILLYKIIPIFMKNEISFNEYYDIKHFKYNKFIMIYVGLFIALLVYIVNTINL